MAAAARPRKGEAMKPPLPRIQSAVPQSLHTQLEIAKAIRTLTVPDEDEALRQRRAEIAALRRDLELLRRDVESFGANVLALAKAELCLVQKYSPDQPRVPMGNPDGGEWTKLGETSHLVHSTDAPGFESGQHSDPRVRYASLESLPGGPVIDTLTGTHYAAGAESDEGSAREENFETSPGEQIRINTAQARLNDLVARVQRIDRNWLPQPGVYGNAEGKIATLEAQAQEAEAFLARARDLGYARDLVTGRRIIWPPNAKTGDPLIDKTTDQLMELLGKVMDENGPRPDLNRQQYGILIHTDFANKLRAGVVPGVTPSDVERTFSLTEDKFYGAEDSARGDYVLTRRDGSIAAFYDIKTGRGMSEWQIIRLRYKSESSRAIPVIELNRERGAILKRR
jgi:hypothetical protein